MDNLESISGMVFDIQHYAVHDGPGIRTIVFLKGCNMRCPWCENPEGIEQGPEIMYNPARCIGDYTCIDICPDGAIRKDSSTGAVVLDRDRCSRCLECQMVCSPEAIRRAGREMSAAAVMEQVLSDRMFYRETGGITISGGEPLLQKDFTMALLRLSAQYHLNRALETNGSVTTSLFREFLPHIDHLLFDLKHMDEKIHKTYTGTGNRQVLQNLRSAVHAVPDVTVRVPIIPGFNMNEKDLLAIARYAESVGVQKLHLLPYHNLGASKNEFLGCTHLSKGNYLTIQQTQILKSLHTGDVLPFKLYIEEKTNLQVTIGG
jgi:pyruvate formate lyase activating enzyme